MNPEIEHTPTPWSWRRIDDEQSVIEIIQPPYLLPICSIEHDSQGECEANAAFIVRAVNSHDKLVSENEALLHIVHKLVNEFATVRDMLNPIVEGKIERGHSLAGLPNGPLAPGFRKTKLADAKKIAVNAQKRINRATSSEKVEPKALKEAGE